MPNRERPLNSPARDAARVFIDTPGWYEVVVIDSDGLRHVILAPIGATSHDATPPLRLVSAES